MPNSVKRKGGAKLKETKVIEKWAKVLLVIALLLIIFGFIHSYVVAKYDAVVIDKRSRASVIAHYIELNLENRLMALAFLAGDSEIASLESNRMIPELQRAVNKLGFFNIVVFDTQGNFIAEANPDLHIGQVYDQESFNKVLVGEQNISNRIVYNGVETAYVSLRVPIHDQNGNVDAVLVAGMPIKQIAEFVNQANGAKLLQNDEYVFILDRNLKFVTHPRLKEIYPKETVYNVHKDFFDYTTGETIAYSPLDHIDKLYTLTTLDHTNWRVAVATPIVSVYEEMIRRSYRDIAIFVLLLITIGLCWRVLLHRQQEKITLESLQMERLSCASQMAASIAHEVRNPLTSIKGFIQLIKRKPDKPAPQSYLEIIIGEIERIEKLVSEFQSLSRPIKPAEFVPVDMAEVVRDVIMLMEGQALNKKVKLNFEIQLDFHLTVIYRAFGDQAQLKQVLINLLRNAIEAVDQAGKIDITMTLRNGNIAIEIHDNGAGIPQEVLVKLGTPFYTTKQNGTGLGLSVCFNIIKNHGGKLEVMSKVGEGTTFTIVLPGAPVAAIQA